MHLVLQLVHSLIHSEEAQSLREVVNILEQRFAILEETLDRIRRGA